MNKIIDNTNQDIKDGLHKELDTELKNSQYVPKRLINKLREIMLILLVLWLLAIAAGACIFYAELLCPDSFLGLVAVTILLLLPPAEIIIKLLR